ncbi:MAG: RlmE/FtsJ family methyltransferase [Sulfobacillus sp.]
MSEVSLNLPYLPAELRTRVVIEPRSLHKDLDQLILENVRRRYERKASTSAGYVKGNSVKVVSRSLGKMHDSSFHGDVSFDVLFQCEVCLPFTGQTFIAQVKNSNDVGLLAVNDPIRAIVARSNNQERMADLLRVQVGDYVEIQVLSFKVQENFVLVVGKFLRAVSESEVVNVLDVSLPDFGLSDVTQAKLETGQAIPDKELNSLSEAVNHGKNALGEFGNLFSEYASLYVFPYEMIWAAHEKSGFYNHPRTVIEFSKDLPVINRAYFKMHEILTKFDLARREEPMRFLQLAEAPGGFIQAIVSYRHKHFPGVQENDSYEAISLRTKPGEGPDWSNKNLAKFLESMKHPVDATREPPSILNYGADGTGDITSLKNVKDLINRHAGKIDLITADGAMDVGGHYSLQEMINAKLVFAEILTTLACQAPNGSAVIKIFDVDYLITFQMIELLRSNYADVGIFKPDSSRVLNSEKYVVCRGFSGAGVLSTEDMVMLLEAWNNFDAGHANDARELRPYVTGIFRTEGDADFKSRVAAYNVKYATRQLAFINEARTLITSGEIYNEKSLRHLKEQQVHNSVSWAERMDLPHVNEAEFIKKDLSKYVPRGKVEPSRAEL